jgi:predicted dehydrogenase
MRVGIIGAGGIVQYAHLPGYQRIPGVEVVAICDPVQARAQEMATKNGIPNVFADFRDMLALELDAVSVCVPNAMHAEAAIAALQAGCHVLCEKPMAVSAAEGEKMVAAATKSGKILMMGFNNRFRADTKALKKLIDSGMFGEIYFARSGWIRRRGIPGRGSWFTQKAMAGGGALIDIGVHALDLTLYLMGKPKAVTVMGATYAKFGGDPGRGTGGWGQAVAGGVFDVDDLACAMIRFDNGATMMLEASWASHIEREHMFVNLMGTEAGAQMLSNPAQARVFSERLGVVQDTTITANEAPGNTAHFTEIAEFVSCVREGRAPMSSGDDGVQVMRILDAIYKSAQLGASVDV